MVEKLTTRMRRPVALLLALLLVVYSTPVAHAAENTYSVLASVVEVDGEYGGTVQINDGTAGVTADASIPAGDTSTITIKPLDARFAIASVTDGTNDLMSNTGYVKNENEHVYTVSGDTTVVATFKRVAYSVETSVNDTEMGTVTVKSGGTEVTGDSAYVALDGSTVEIAPTDARFAIASVTDGANKDITKESGYFVSDGIGIYSINSDTNLVVTFERVAYKVDARVAGNVGGTVTVNGGSTAFIDTENTSATIKIAPSTGYVAEEIAINDADPVKLEGNENYNVQNGEYTAALSDDMTVVVTFIKTYKVDVSVTEIATGEYGGTVKIDNGTSGTTATTTVKNGASAVITITPDNDYVVKSITVNGTDKTDDYNNDGTFEMTGISADTNVVVTFIEQHKLTIKADKSSGNEHFTVTDKTLGEITLGSTLRVNDGTKLELSIVPAVGNVITSVKIDGEQQLNTTQQQGLLSYDLPYPYTVENDTEIVVTSVEREYNIEFTVDENGDINYETGSGGSGAAGDAVADVVGAGDKVELTIAPKLGYKIVSVEYTHNGKTVKYDETSQDFPGEGESLTITLEKLESAATVTAKFEPRFFNVAVSAEGRGSVSINDGDGDGDTDNSDDNFKFATEAEITITPEEGYQIKTITVDGEEVELTDYDPANGAYVYRHTLSDAKNIKIEVKFKIRNYSVSALVENNVGGSVAMVDKSGDENEIIEAEHFSEATMKIVPAEGYRVDGITYNEELLDLSTDSYVENADNSSVYTITVDCDTVLVVTFIAVDSIAESAGFTITPTVGSAVAGAPTPDTNADYRFYTNDAELLLEPVAGYDRIRVKYSGDTAYGEWMESIAIDESKIVEAIEVKTVKGRNAAKIAQTKPIVLVMDTDAPTVTASAATKWVNGTAAEVSLNGTAADAASTTAGVPMSGVKRVVWSTTELDAAGVIASTNDATLSADGSYSFTAPYADTFYIYSQDYADNVSAAVTVSVPRDSAAPRATQFAFSSAASIKYGDPATISSREITLTVSVSDPGASSGLDEIALYYREPGASGGTLISSQQLTSGTPQFTLAESIFRSEKEIYVVVTDNVGNSSGEITPTSSGVTSEAKGDSVIIDSTGPSVSISGGDSGWSNSSVSFSISTSDSDSGIESVVIRLNGSQTSGGSYSNVAPADSKSRSFSVTASNDGSNTVTVEVTNKAGLTASATASVNIDQNAPSITSFEFAKAESSAADNVLNFLTFGLFSNDKVNVTVTAADSADASGVSSITLYVGGEEFDTANVSENNTATFTVPASAIVSGELLFNDVISATATDNAGNTMQEATVADESNSNMQGDLMVETVEPTISVTVSDPVGDMNPLTAVSGDWYSGNAEFSVTFADEHSGISSTEITVNGESLSDDTDGSDIGERFSERNEKLTEQTFDISTSQGDIAEDGSYTITASTVDNAGNESEVYSHTVYKDVSVPEIIGFDFETENYVEGAEDVVQVEVTDYGFYFRENTRVTVSSFDAAPSSGVKEITYYLVDIDSGSTEEITAAVDASGKISFVVEADFKGQIYAKATDNVLNTAANFVSPDRAILESPELHAAETHITLVKENATYVDASGGEYYEGNVPVTVTITDTYSGLRSIEWSVSAPYDTGLNDSGTVVFANDGTVIAGSETDWTQVDSDANLVTEISKTILVSHNSNDIVLRVSMTDRAGNTSSDEITFSIDKVAPVISIEYNNNAPDAEYTDIYDAGRIATITVTERNFDPERINVEVTNTDGEPPALSGWTEYRNTTDPDASYYQATINYETDGDYTFAIDGSDMAENVAPEVEDDAFTIDTTAPTIAVSYADEEVDPADGEPAEDFFNVGRTATITIIEHNFDPGRVVITGDATEVEGAVFPGSSVSWTSVGDEHTARIVYSGDAHYTFDITVNDMAGTPSEDYAGDEFTIDTTDPVIELTGVETNSAYSGVVAPVITYSDINLDVESVTISLVGVNLGAVDYEVTSENITDGVRITYADFEDVKEVDDIYTLTVELRDLAGNISTDTVTFSVNRYGSTYDMSSISEFGGRYLQSVGDLVFTEINVTPISSISIRLTQNGVPKDLVEGVDYFVESSGGNGEWSVNTYRISEALFAENGTYSLAVYSVDAAGNINENIDESKAAEIVFGIDKTAPIVVSIDLVSGEQYAVETKNVSATITDNLVLESVVIFLNDVEVQYLIPEGSTLEDVLRSGSFVFDIPESTELQTVRIVARDAAGNEYEQVIEDFLVSTSMFVRWYSNTPLFVGSLVGAGVVVIGGTAAIALGVSKKRRKGQA